jgi:hypothetical protein
LSPSWLTIELCGQAKKKSAADNPRDQIRQLYCNSEQGFKTACSGGGDDADIAEAGPIFAALGTACRIAASSFGTL